MALWLSTAVSGILTPKKLSASRKLANCDEGIVAEEKFMDFERKRSLLTETMRVVIEKERFSVKKQIHLYLSELFDRSTSILVSSIVMSLLRTSGITDWSQEIKKVGISPLSPRGQPSGS